MPIVPLTFHFKDDGVSVPNNPLPMVIYRNAINFGNALEPARVIETKFKANGWGRDMWRNGIFPYTHYHSMIHEALGVARGRAKVRFGGPHGEEIDIDTGDVAILPAGTGHQGLWTSPDLIVIGAYPPEGTYNLCRGGKIEYEKALATIPQVPLPSSDPLLGKDGPLLGLWRK